MPTGVYVRTQKTRDAISAAQRGVPKSPEHCVAISKGKLGISLSPEHCNAISNGKMGHSVSSKTRNAISKTLIEYEITPEHCDAISKGLIGHDTSDETKKKISDSVTIAWEDHPENHAEGIESMRGGEDICDHHYIYDHSDLSKYTMKMTRSRHAWLHHLLKRVGISIPHINIKEVL